MSTSELAGGPFSAVSSTPARLVSTRFLRSELGLVFRRRRNQAMLAVLASGPILLGIAIRAASPTAGQGPPFMTQVTQNGLFLGLASVVVAMPLFLPLAISVVAGESVAGEASTGTLRNVLVVPAGRTRLLGVKFAGVAAYALVCAVTVIGVGIVAGLVLFPAGDVVLLSGTAIGLGEALVRAGLVTLYVGAMLATVAAVGVFASTLTEVPMGAMAATATLTVVSQILDTIPQVSVIHEYLYTHWWFAFGDVLRDPVALGNVGTGLLTQAAYVAVFGTLAWARFTTKDMTA